MAAPLEVRQKQRIVIEFLVSEGESPLNISKRLDNVFKNDAIDYSTVKRWVQRFKGGEEEMGKASVSDRPRSGRPASAVNPASLARADALIKADRRVTVDEIATALDISHGSAVNVFESLGYGKVCARWVPRKLTEAHREARVEACSELLEQHQSDDSFLRVSRIVTGDETWVHHYVPESKRKSMEWRHPDSPRTKKFKAQRSAGKVMASVFWDSKEVILVDFMPKGATINSEAYIETLKKLKARIRRVRPDLDMSKVLLQHDNARPHTSIRTREVLT